MVFPLLCFRDGMNACSSISAVHGSEKFGNTILTATVQVFRLQAQARRQRTDDRSRKSLQLR
jgi:hypothetical protein